DALNRATRRWYNSSNEVTAITNNTPALPSTVGATDEVRYFYDNQTLPGGAPSFTHGASIGRLVATTYGSSSSAGDYYAFDAVGRHILKIQQTGSLNYQSSAAYILSGAITSETYPSLHAISYNYDAAGRLADLDSQNLA